MAAGEALTASCAAQDGVDTPPFAKQVTPKACGKICRIRAKWRHRRRNLQLSGASDKASLSFEGIRHGARVSKRLQRAGEMFRQHVVEARGMSGDQVSSSHPSAQKSLSIGTLSPRRTGVSLSAGISRKAIAKQASRPGVHGMHDPSGRSERTSNNRNSVNRNRVAKSYCCSFLGYPHDSREKTRV